MLLTSDSIRHVTPATIWRSLERWYLSVGPEAAGLAAARHSAALVAAWLGCATGLQLLRSLPGLGGLGGIADRISPRSLQRLGRGLAGMSLTAGLAVPAPSAGTLELHEDPSAGLPEAPAAVPVEVVTSDPSTAVLHLVEEVSASQHTVPQTPPPGVEEVVVVPGDSLWSLAESAVQERLGMPTSTRDVARYWVRVVEMNRPRLVDPSNPDLIFPGQTLVLPDL
jgi:hypothetical protein